MCIRQRTFLDLSEISVSKIKCKIEQRCAVKFGFKFGKSAAETVQMMASAYGETTMSKALVHVWYNRFTKVDKKKCSLRSAQDAL